MCLYWLDHWSWLIDGKNRLVYLNDILQIGLVARNQRRPIDTTWENFRGLDTNHISVETPPQYQRNQHEPSTHQSTWSDQWWFTLVYYEYWWLIHQPNYQSSTNNQPTINGEKFINCQPSTVVGAKVSVWNPKAVASSGWLPPCGWCKVVCIFAAMKLTWDTQIQWRTGWPLFAILAWQ